MSKIPIIDFGAHGLHVKDTSIIDNDALVALGEEVKHSFSTIGFAYLKNHGVDEKLISDFMRVSREFFEQPMEEKEKCGMSKEIKSGWLGSEQETLNQDRPADLKESYSYAPSYEPKVWPSTENFEVLAKRMFETCTELFYRFLDVLSHGLKLPPEFMRNAHRLIGQKGNPTALRTLYYPPLQENAKAGQVRLGEHTDYGTVTFLFQDDIGGLDVKSDGRFIPATPISGTVLVNIGCLLQQWTSDTLVATTHRVLIPEEEIRRRKCRQSIVFFSLSDDEFLVKCLDGSDKYEPIKTIDYLNYRFNQAYTK